MKMSKDFINEKRKNIIVLNIMFFLFSFSGVLSKLAAQQPMFSVGFFCYYAGTLCIMAIYAIVWQQIIHKLPLMVAYANKAVVVIWGLLWGLLFFHETITFGKVIGVVLVAAGVALFAKTYEVNNE